MAKFKVKKNNIPKLRKQLKGQITTRAKRVFPALLEEQIIEKNILKGRSPVFGAGKYEKYSSSYKKQIRRSLSSFGKKPRPVNLKLSGQLLSTFFVKFKGKGIKVGFSDKVAEFHNEGTSNMPQRKMIPGKGEKFNQSITRAINTALTKIVRQVVKTKV